MPSPFTRVNVLDAKEHRGSASVQIPHPPYGAPTLPAGRRFSSEKLQLESLLGTPPTIRNSLVSVPEVATD